MTSTNLHYHWTIFVVFIGIILSLIVMAFGAPIIPPFPFQNTQQLGPGTPDWASIGGPQMAICGEFQMAMFQFTPPGTDFDKTLHGFQVYVSLGTQDITAAYFAGARFPLAVYFGTVHPEKQHITITSAELFDPAKHQTPCDRWK